MARCEFTLIRGHRCNLFDNPPSPFPPNFPRQHKFCSKCAKFVVRKVPKGNPFAHHFGRDGSCSGGPR